MKNTTFLLFLFSWMFSPIFAQEEMEYINPPIVQHDLYTLEIKDIISKEDYCKFRLLINNKSNSYMAYDISKVGFLYDNLGTYYPSKKKIVIVPPNKRIVETIKISGNINYMVSHFSVQLEGLSYAPTVEFSPLDSIPLEEGNSPQDEQLNLVVKKVKSKKGKFSFSIAGEFSGKDNEFCVLNPEAISFVDSKNQPLEVKLTPKKLQLLKDGKKVTINGSFESEDENIRIYWNNAYELYTLYPESIKTILLHQVGTPPVSATELHPTASGCPAVTGNTSGYTRVTFFNSEKKCFKMFVNGALISNDYSANVTFKTGPGKKRIEYHFANGHVLKDNVFINSDWLEASYRLKPKRNSYAVNLIWGSVVSDGTGPLNQTMNNTNKTTTSKPSFKATIKTSVNGKTTSESIEIN
ncbi:hypothetical protein [Aureispira anguillae]|uniref:Uncharacterized protein n=1 Tax=Aureispira anguillae TaxID=2864201 RepID=A0A915YC33_9BACT|nr:hypothetical protein [Aureispira anguillae]BDS10288.1 hypothetical protein AsAng_0009960 [Aureispira anguillae]